MATIKSYTDLEQSKKLAEILPIESADMHYNDWNDDFCVGYKHTGEYIADLGAPTTIRGELEIPCWSLAGLLSIIPNYQLQTQDDGIGILCSCNGNFNIVTANTPIDTCYEMILKLHELNLLWNIVSIVFFLMKSLWFAITLN